jgi:toxin HigB-1
VTIFKVDLTKEAKRDLRKVPKHIAYKLAMWTDSIEKKGLIETRKVPGYHDEPLKGKRKGQRSIRLSKAYRAIYDIKNNQKVEFISILEVNKHEY